MVSEEDGRPCAWEGYDEDSYFISSMGWKPLSLTGNVVLFSGRPFNYIWPETRHHDFSVQDKSPSKKSREQKREATIPP